MVKWKKMTPGREAWLAAAACVRVCVCVLDSLLLCLNTARENKTLCVCITQHMIIYTVNLQLYTTSDRETHRTNELVPSEARREGVNVTYDVSDTLHPATSETFTGI